MNAKEIFTELRLLIRDIGVLLSALPLEAGEFEELESEVEVKVKEDTDQDKKFAEDI